MRFPASGRSRRPRAERRVSKGWTGHWPCATRSAVPLLGLRCEPDSLSRRTETSAGGLACPLVFLRQPASFRSSLADPQAFFLHAAACTVSVRQPAVRLPFRAAAPPSAAQVIDLRRYGVSA